MNKYKKEYVNHNNNNHNNHKNLNHQNVIYIFILLDTQ